MSSDNPQLVLASASPRRKQLLEQLGVPFAVIPSTIAEEHRHHETPEQFASRLSEEKAAAVAASSDVHGRWFIGCDTIVVCDNTILGKPVNASDAKRMLRMLSGRSHRVISAYAIVDRHGSATVSRYVSTTVTMRTLTDADIEGYIATGEPVDKAGAYAIQGLGACLVTAISGSYTNVVGLPLAEISADLIRLGIITRLFTAP